jgi:TolB-like protein
MQTSTKRRLAAILAADAVGYSRLMNRDEEAGLTALPVRRRLIEAAIAAHQGRIFSGAGDSILAEFASALDAVRCAVAAQKELGSLNAQDPAERRLAFRIGINLGDVTPSEDGNLWGDCVNTAVRLESIADPGGICLSEDAYRQVRTRTDLRFDDLGPRALKNIADPVRVYRLVADDASPAAMRDAPSPAAARGTGIVVLPFDNLSGDPDQEFFCDGLSNDIITDLSRFPELLVIAANSAFAYKGRHRKVQEITAELGVAYLLEGSVQKAGGRVRVNAQLIEGATGHHLWADRFERELSDLFALQDEIIRRIVGALPGRLREIEGRRALRKDPVDVSAYEAYLRGTFLYSIESEAALARCRAQFERATVLDPSFARAWGYLAYTGVQAWIAGWADEAALAEAENRARLAVSLDPADYANHWDLAFVYLNTRRFDLALDEYTMAASLNPNDADLLAEMAEMLVFEGQTQRALDQLGEAMRRNPFYPDWYRWVLAWALFNAERFGEALGELERMSRPPAHVDLLRAALRAKLGDSAGASGALSRFLADRPGWSIAKEKARGAFRREEDEARWLDALAAAGLPVQ